jgi:hypothetical protein
MPYLVVSDSGRSCFASIEILRRTIGNTVAPVAVAYTDQPSELMDGLRALGLVTVTSDQIAAAIKVLHPHGIVESDRGGVLRAIFLHLRRQDRGDNVGR